jgi:hypothetical protein
VALIAIVVVVTVASGGGSERAQVAADPECVEAWNDDAAARAYGRHNFSFHLYKGALVTYLDEAGNEVGAGEGLCAVVFPAEALDPEPFAAGQVLRGKRWTPISELDQVELARVGELQVLAAGAPNTTLDVRGVLAAL